MKKGQPEYKGKRGKYRKSGRIDVTGLSRGNIFSKTTLAIKKKKMYNIG